MSARPTTCGWCRRPLTPSTGPGRPRAFCATVCSRAHGDELRRTRARLRKASIDLDLATTGTLHWPRKRLDAQMALIEELTDHLHDLHDRSGQPTPLRQWPTEPEPEPRYRTNRKDAPR